MSSGGSQPVKGKVVPVNAMKAYRGSRGVAPLILKFGFRGRSVKFAPGTCYHCTH